MKWLPLALEMYHSVNNVKSLSNQWSLQAEAMLWYVRAMWIG